MKMDIEQSYKDHFSKEFEYRVPKDGVIKIDTKEICNSIPNSIFGGKNGSLSLSGSLIYYSPEKEFTGTDEIFFSATEEGKNVITKIKLDIVSTFKPKAHILILLGEELIKSPVMAIYELIKNGYDADSKKVEVKFENIEDIDNAQINITDYGTGITKEVLENVWFEPGTDGDGRKPIDRRARRAACATARRRDRTHEAPGAPAMPVDCRCPLCRARPRAAFPGTGRGGCCWPGRPFPGRR